MQGNNPHYLERLSRFISGVVYWRRRVKRIVLATLDGIALTVVLWVLISARYGEFYLPADWLTAGLIAMGPLLIVSALLLRNGYHEVTRFIGLRGSFKLVTTVLFASLAWATTVMMSAQKGIPRTSIIAFVAFAPLCVVLLRNFCASLLRWSGVHLPDRSMAQDRMPVAIYGASRLGSELGYALAGNKTRKLVAFFDDSAGVIGRTIDGIRVFSPDRLDEIVAQKGIEEVILAQDGILRPDGRLKLLKRLERHGVRLRILPELDAMASGRVSWSQMRPVRGHELLGRTPVPPDNALLRLSVSDKVVLVTGGGGSIGAEIARRCYSQNPKKLIIIDNSELALFKIEQDLIALQKTESLERTVPFTLRLGTVLDRGLINDILRQEKVDTIFHAAAYKHVPIVESNPVVGVRNNVFGTHCVAAAARDQNVERFVLISTDKAVRPTSVLGASKRLAELVVQALASEPGNTKFCSVRFGNVLGSSGSVFEKFIDQIQSGGPVTVTDPDMVRYFMSIEEAASLVLQAASMASRGETYLLDMGEPVRVLDMARSLILLLGYTEKTETNTGGEIEIRFTGLRPGEKLIEELLTDPQSASETFHPQIHRSHEPSLPAQRIWQELANLERAIESRDAAFIVASLRTLVPDYQVSPSLMDSIAAKELNSIN